MIIRMSICRIYIPSIVSYIRTGLSRIKRPLLTQQAFKEAGIGELLAVSGSQWPQDC